MVRRRVATWIGKCILGVAACCVLQAAAIAAPMVSLSGVPGTYTPGGTFSFDVLLSDYTDLSGFEIELVLSASDGTAVAGTDFLFESATAGNIFGVDSTFLPRLQADGTFTLHFASLSDYHSEGGEVSGTLGTAATVTVRTARDVGELSIEFDPSFLFLVDANFNPIPGFDELVIEDPPALLPSGSGPVVPEPTSLLIWGALGCSSVLLRRRRA